MSTEVPKRVTALIADDEHLLRTSLRRELQKAWPDLQIVAELSNGDEALQRLRVPDLDIAFLDIQMPGTSGLEVARTLVLDWSDTASDYAVGWPPLLVFVTAYSEFALEAFESAAVDYILKPVTPDRLALTVSRLQARLRERKDTSPAIDISALNVLAQQLAQLAEEPTAPTPSVTSPYLKFVRASIGESVRMIPIEHVVLFEAADKYVVVHCADGESLIRESLRELSKNLDPALFQQIHRSSIVNMQAVRVACRDAHGKLVLTLSGIKKTPPVSRLYTHLFKAM